MFWKKKQFFNPNDNLQFLKSVKRISYENFGPPMRFRKRLHHLKTRAWNSISTKPVSHPIPFRKYLEFSTAKRHPGESIQAFLFVVGIFHVLVSPFLFDNSHCWRIGSMLSSHSRENRQICSFWIWGLNPKILFYLAGVSRRKSSMYLYFLELIHF